MLAAYAAANESIPTYAHRFSPHKFTQPQLLACLVLKTFYDLDYRGICQLLLDSLDFRAAIQLKSVPHWTTLQKASCRLLRLPLFRKLHDQTVDRIMKRRKIVHLAAVDSTGYESRHTSRYYVRRRGKTDETWEKTTYKRFPKLALMVDTRSHAILSAIPSRGPSPDINELVPILDHSTRRVVVESLVADAGYDSESNHRYARWQHGITTLIPPLHGRPGRGPPNGYYRRLMKQYFNKRKYGQRWQIETVNSMMKRNLGCELAARTYQSQCREMLVMVLTHNLSIFILIFRVFYRARKRRN